MCGRSSAGRAGLFFRFRICGRHTATTPGSGSKSRPDDCLRRTQLADADGRRSSGANRASVQAREYARLFSSVEAQTACFQMPEAAIYERQSGYLGRELMTFGWETREHFQKCRTIIVDRLARGSAFGGAPELTPTEHQFREVLEAGSNALARFGGEDVARPARWPRVSVVLSAVFTGDFRN